MKPLAGLLLAVVLASFAIACGGSDPDGEATPAQTGMSGMPGHGGMTGTTSPDQPFDAMFIDSMIEHHQGAVDMANEALSQASRPEILALADAIIESQSEEIAQLKAWRTEWYPSMPPTGGMSMSMGEMEVSSDDDVPYDQRFIDAMIPHHESAVDMANMALDQSDREEIRTLADEIIRAQMAEIAQMKEWKAEWFK